MPTPGTSITPQELQNAEEELVKYEQSRSFPSWVKAQKGGMRPKAATQPLEKLSPILVNNILRVGGRIDRANLAFETKHPAILDQKGQLTLNQIAQKYWIINAKSAIKKMIGKCLTCRRRTVKPCQQMMAELPESRLQFGEPPFSQSGVDYFGPLIVRVGRSE